jgi:release factor glutamine methyltransferase
MSKQTMQAGRASEIVAEVETWAEVISDAANRLDKAGVESPRHDAEELAAHVLGIRRSRLALRLREPADKERLARYEVLVEKRRSRFPLQLITGITGFRKIELEIDEGVFIPRPETETLVEVVLSQLKTREFLRPARILDIGTGSGAVALSIASELGDCRVVATDISGAALECASRNARRLGVADRVIFLSADLLSAFAESANSYFDAIVSNPPYIPTDDIDRLPPEVRNHDPWRALDGGSDGLSAVWRILEKAPPMVAPGGLLAIEIGDAQAESVEFLDEAANHLGRCGMVTFDPIPDACGRRRVLYAQRPSDADNQPCLRGNI